jgi:hypothetical protein
MSVSIFSTLWCPNCKQPIPQRDITCPWCEWSTITKLPPSILLERALRRGEQINRLLYRNFGITPDEFNLQLLSADNNLKHDTVIITEDEP